MELSEKAKYLVETAKAYFARGNWVQYDQRCMDRSTFLTPRRIKLIPPEAATAQKTIYLDCSSFVGAVYYEAFGYELSSDLTWHMIDLVEPKVYYYEFTHNETEADKEKICRDIKKILIPGDVITYDRGVGSGHTVLYLGEEKVMHCTPNGRPDGYDYKTMQSREYDDGGLFIDDLDYLLGEERLMKPKTRRMSIARPLMNVGEPTERATARLCKAYGLKMGVETSSTGLKNVPFGETIEYKLNITETTGEKRTLTTKIVLPDTVGVVGSDCEEIDILPNETKTVIFKVKPAQKDAFVIENVKIYVEDFEVFVPNVLIGNILDEVKEKELLKALKEGVKTHKTALSLAVEAYKKIGITLLDNERSVIEKLFYLHDVPTGDVLSRRNQFPFTDAAVYGFFGGTGVITPEMIRHPFIRANQILPRDFIAGDIILISNDACAKDTFSVVYTGESLIGKFTNDGELEVIKGEEIDKFFDSLLGRFCFAVLRPSLKVN